MADGNAEYSYSRVSTWESCRFKYKCQYVDKLEAIKDNLPDNALICGTAMHESIEGVPEWRENYLNDLVIASDGSETEILKVELLSEKVREWLAEKFVSVTFEKEVKTSDGYIGYIDCIAVDITGKKWVIDFKYSNSDYYLESPQIHVYKFILETFYNEHIDGIMYLFIPKPKIRQKKTETLQMFRNRLREVIEETDIRPVEVTYNPEKVTAFLTNAFDMRFRTPSVFGYDKMESKLCEYCDYKTLCKDGKDFMLIPKNEKVKTEKDTLKKVYLYGAPFSGKTYLANKFEDALLLNSDGNTKYVDSPRIHICDVVTMDGRIEKRKLAWELFKDVITELEHGDGKEYKTIVVDLLEDMYEYCRLYMYKVLKISHESDDNFSAWDKVRTEFLSTIKRLVALPFNIVLISQEDCSRDITRRGGEKITSIAPSLNEKVARKVAGMVDIVLRVVNDNGARTLQNKPSDTVFGGGRLNLTASEYPCEYASIIAMYNGNISEV